MIANGSVNVKREDLKRFFSSKTEVSVPTLKKFITKARLKKLSPQKDEHSTGYIVFARPPLNMSLQKADQKGQRLLIDLSLRVVRNEFEPISFSLYPLRDLGEVKITITDLKSNKGAIFKDKIKIGYVESGRRCYWASCRQISKTAGINQTGKSDKG